MPTGSSINNLHPQSGTYAVIFSSQSKAKVRFGRWGQLDLVSGYYVYVGSAFGPGGVQARVSRHCRKIKPKHWHIDYVLEFLQPVGVWCSYESERLEHRWAQAFADISSMSSVQGFGCSDCKCNSHLFNASTKPNFMEFSNLVGGDVESYSLLQSTSPRLRIEKKAAALPVDTLDFNRIRCPLCKWQPKPSHRWFCAPCNYPEYFDDGCGACWNTFSTRGRCPGCGHQWRWTACLHCARWSLHADWYENRSDRRR
jgi:Uri superfamily endonuclease